MNGEQDWDAHRPGGYAPPPSYGPPPAYGPPPSYGPHPGYGQQPGYGQHPGYGPAPGYGPPAYGQVAPWNMPPHSTTWPYGPARPGVATAAIALGHVTGGLTALVSLFFLFAMATGDGDPVLSVLLLGLPCAGGMIGGSVVLARQDPPSLLFASSVAAIAVLVVALLAGAATLNEQDMFGLLVFVVFALVLPVLTAVYARLPRVRGWAAQG
jgi:hypothetical protein